MRVAGLINLIHFNIVIFVQCDATFFNIKILGVGFPTNGKEKTVCRNDSAACKSQLCSIFRPFNFKVTAVVDIVDILIA